MANARACVRVPLGMARLRLARRHVRVRECRASVRKRGSRASEARGDETATAAASTSPPVRWRAVGLLGAFGASCGTLVDGLHNQSILEYKLLPVSIDVAAIHLKTSAVVPALLSVAYVILGMLAQNVAARLLGGVRTIVPSPRAAALSPGARAAAAVASTAAIVRTSAFAAGPLALPTLSAMAIAQWALLDGTDAALAVAAAAAIAGPVAEL